MPKKPYQSVKFDAFFYTFNFFTKEPLFLLLVEANLFLAIFKYSILLSMPTNFRFCFLHTTPVVPLPQNGSKTRSPVLLDANIALLITPSGFCVGCLPKTFSE